jgi:hypothetical protein
MKIKVVNHGPSPLVLRGEAGQVSLELGAVHVDQDTLSKILANPKAKALFEACCTAHPEQVEGQLDAAPPGPVVPIAKLSKKAALQQIAKCKDVQILRLWAHQDAREDIRKALQLRWRELTPEAEGTDIQVST